MIEERIFLFDEFNRWIGFSDEGSKSFVFYGTEDINGCFSQVGIGYTRNWQQLSKEQRDSIMFEFRDPFFEASNYVTRTN
ncbi:MAG: hypothetical protein N0C90_12985 [Candidatus Thiodiazotropha endolucinida]|nr:hypothetical protein [Candidatus Thiodiazotropha taylori]MCW4262276.1 hypothetical protein [Candidatus Thiodiazotropha endolucinida]